MSQRLSNLEVQFGEAHSRISSLEAQLKTANSELHEIKSKADKQQSDTTQQNQTIDILEKRVSSAEVMMINQQRQILQIGLGHETHRNQTSAQLNNLGINVQTIVTLEKRVSTTEIDLKNQEVELNKTIMDLRSQRNETVLWRQTIIQQSNMTKVRMDTQQQEILQLRLDHEAHHNKTTVRLNDADVNFQRLGTVEKRLGNAENELNDHEVQLNKTIRDIKIQHNETILWRQTADQQSNLTNAMLLKQQQQILHIRLDHETYRNRTGVRLNDLDVNVATTVQSMANLTIKINVSLLTRL